MKFWFAKSGLKEPPAGIFYRILAITRLSLKKYLLING